MNLAHGECIVASMLSTNPQSVFIANERPSVSNTSGETLRTTRSDD